MRKTVTGMVFVGLMLPVAAQAMTVGEFLAKADALKAKGVLALGSPDIALLRDEVTAARTAYRADLATQLAAGKKPHSCPPPVGQSKISSDDLIAEFRMVPPAKRNISVKTAFYAMMKKRFPCKA